MRDSSEDKQRAIGPPLISLRARCADKFDVSRVRGSVRCASQRAKSAAEMTRLSSHHFRSNEVRLWLNLLAYNLGNLWRWLVLPKIIDHWLLTSLQQGLVKKGGRLPNTPGLTGFCWPRAT